MGVRYQEFGWKKEKVNKILQWRRDSDKCDFGGFETKSLPEQHLRQVLTGSKYEWMLLDGGTGKLN